MPLSSKYHNLLDVFSKTNAESLPTLTEDNIKINLLPNTSPPFGVVYQLATQEQRSLKEYVNNMLAKGLICESSSLDAFVTLQSSLFQEIQGRAGGLDW